MKRRGHFSRQLRQPEETGDGGVADNAEGMDQGSLEDDEVESADENEARQLGFLAGVSVDRTETTYAKAKSVHEDTSANAKVGKWSSGLRGVHGVAKRKGF